MSKIVINFSDDRTVAYGKLQNGRTFIIDSKVWDKIKTVKIHLTRRSSIGKQYYIYRKDTSKNNNRRKIVIYIIDIHKKYGKLQLTK